MVPEFDIVSGFFPHKDLPEAYQLMLRLAAQNRGRIFFLVATLTNPVACVDTTTLREKYTDEMRVATGDYVPD